LGISTAWQTINAEQSRLTISSTNTVFCAFRQSAIINLHSAGKAMPALKASECASRNRKRAMHGGISQCQTPENSCRTRLLLAHLDRPFQSASVAAVCLASCREYPLGPRFGA